MNIETFINKCCYLSLIMVGVGVVVHLRLGIVESRLLRWWCLRNGVRLSAFVGMLSDFYSWDVIYPELAGVVSGTVVGVGDISLFSEATAHRSERIRVLALSGIGTCPIGGIDGSD
jgi:hypothetical protein